MDTQTTTATTTPSPSKRGKLAKVSTAEDFSTLTFAFGPDGSVGTRQVNIADLSATHPYALAYGYRQILQDSYAGSESADHALAGFDKRFQSLANGEIRTRGESEPKEDPNDVLFDAWMLKVSRMPARPDGKTINAEAVRRDIENADKARKAQIRKALQAEIYEVRAERARKSGTAPELDLFSDDLAA